jgi:hypothetical protein
MPTINSAPGAGTPRSGTISLGAAYTIRSTPAMTHAEWHTAQGSQLE